MYLFNLYPKYSLQKPSQCTVVRSTLELNVRFNISFNSPFISLIWVTFKTPVAGYYTKNRKWCLIYFDLIAVYNFLVFLCVPPSIYCIAISLRFFCGWSFPSNLLKETFFTHNETAKTQIGLYWIGFRFFC